MDADADITVASAGAARLREIAPLWGAMHAHHSTMQQDVAATREVEESWRRRRPQYEAWLAGGEGCLLVAEREGVAVGYAFVTVGPGPPTWDLGEPVAELQSLAVAVEHRGAGAGAALLSAARDVARGRGARTMLVGVAHANGSALRFYERQGFAPFYALLLGRTGA